MTTFPNPIVHHPFEYSFGPISLTGFGLAVLLCFLVAQHVAQSELARRGHDPAPVSDMIFAAVVGGLLGAKLYYVLVLGHHDALFERGGFVFWGGLIGGILAVMGVVVKKRYGLMKVFDVAGPAVAAAYAVGRTGCWAIGDDYGRPWTGFLAVAFPDGAPPSTAAIMSREFGAAIPAGVGPNTVLPVFPTQLYEVVLGLAMFGVLWRLRDHRHAEGWLWGVYCVLAGAERFVIEFFRAKDDRLLMMGLTYAQVIALVFVAAGVVWMMICRTPREGRPGIHATPALSS